MRQIKLVSQCERYQLLEWSRSNVVLRVGALFDTIIVSEADAMFVDMVAGRFHRVVVVKDLTLEENEEFIAILEGRRGLYIALARRL